MSQSRIVPRAHQSLRLTCFQDILRLRCQWILTEDTEDIVEEELQDTEDLTLRLFFQP